MGTEETMKNRKIYIHRKYSFCFKILDTQIDHFYTLMLTYIKSKVLKLKGYQFKVKFYLADLEVMHHQL